MTTESPPRELTTFRCPCGLTCQHWLRPHDPRQCHDCQDKADRERIGWNKFNSRN